MTASDPGSSVSSTGLTLAQLADRKSARSLQIQLLKLKLAAEEKSAEAERALEQKRLAAEERKAEADRALE